MAGSQQRSSTNPSSKPKKHHHHHHHHHRNQTKPSRLQKQAPAALKVTPVPPRSAEGWKLAIPLLTPLILSPSSPGDPEEDRMLEFSSSTSSLSGPADQQIQETPSFMTWQHPAAPFYSDPTATPLINQPFVDRCR